MKHDLVRSMYEHFLGEITTTRDPVSKSQYFMYCISNAMVLQREGQTDVDVPLDEEIKETLLAATKKTPPSKTIEPAKELLQKCKKFAGKTETSFPNTIADEIVMAWRLRLDMDFQILYLDGLDEAEGMKPVVEWLRACARESDKILMKNLPCPLRVAEGLRKISKEYYLNGSPLFGWWETLPRNHSVVEPYSQSVESEGSEEKKESTTDWENAPQVVRDWDMKVVEGILRNAAKKYSR